MNENSLRYSRWRIKPLAAVFLCFLILFTQAQDDACVEDSDLTLLPDITTDGILWPGQEDCCLPENLIDGMVSTRWSVEQFPTTATIDLKEIYPIGKTKLYPYKQRPYLYKVEVSSDGVNFITTVDRTSSSSANSVIEDEFETILGRYVRLTVTGCSNNCSKWVALNEFKIFCGTIQENVAPQVKILHPDNDVILRSRGEMPYEVSATDSDGIVNNVNFYVNNERIKTFHSSPYKDTLRNLPPGDLEIYATAFDNSGNSASTEVIKLIVSNPIGDVPEITFNNLAEGQSFTQGTSVTISVSISDADGDITASQLFIDERKVLEGSGSSLSYLSNSFGIGNHEVFAQATDNDGNTVYSDTITFLIQRAALGKVVNQNLLPEESWLNGHNEKVTNLLYAKDWDANSTSRSDHDNGKRYWPLLLSQLVKTESAEAAMELINNEGRSGVFAENEGTFYKPFSAPGLNFYLFSNLENLPREQIDRIKYNWENKGRNYASRIDGSMDPIYDCAEYNSENFNWMARLGGYLQAEFFDDNEILKDGLSAKDYFENYLNNLVRATLSAGRVEWNSHVYSGFCFQAAAQLYEFTSDLETKAKARALMDWILAETAIRYLDGSLIGPESRDKGAGWEALSGSIWPYYYLYFESDIPKQIAQERIVEEAGIWSVGFPPNMTYEPLQVVVDIANRKFDFPVEIQSAKPRYGLDVNNYEDWQGQDEGRRFEFETMYLHENYTMASIASYRPRGQDVFVEQAIWRFGVKQEGTTALQIFGNAGNHGGYNDASGRSPHEEIGQFRNIMMRMIKGTDELFIAVPNVLSPAFSGDTLFVEMGSDVYAAFIPYNQTGKSSRAYDPSFRREKKFKGYSRYTWNFPTSEIGALILEVGTQQEHGSFEAFRKSIYMDARIQNIETDQLEYISTLGDTLKMEFVPPVTYTFTEHSCSEKAIPIAGVPGKVWGNGEFMDYEDWDSYQVVYGDNIIKQKWGGLELILKSEKNGVAITADRNSAEVSYRQAASLSEEVDESVLVLSTNVNPKIKVYPNPNKGQITIEGLTPSLSVINIFDTLGRSVLSFESHRQEVKLDLSKLEVGLYLIQVHSEGKNHSFKMLVD